MPESSFVPLALSDLEEVLRIERVACRFPWSRGNFADSVVDGHVCQAYRCGDVLLGYFVLMMAVDEAHLLNIVVAPAAQGNGLGACFLHRVMQIAQGAGARTLLLEVRPSNTQALALYRRFGFQQIGVRRNYYRDTDGCEDAIVMARVLLDITEMPQWRAVAMTCT